MTVTSPELPIATFGTLDDAPSLLVDGGYGWVCVAACFIINCFTWGLVSVYGVYLSYYLRDDSFPGASPLDFAFVGGLTFAAAMLVAPLVTFLTRKYGTRPPMLFGVLSLAGGFVSASFAVKAWHLCLSQGALVGIGVGCVYIPSIPILSQWFSKKRSLANGITSAGSGIGGVIFSLTTNSMIENISVGWSLRITGVVAFLMTTIAVLLIKDRNDVIIPRQHPFDVQLLFRYDVWLLLLWAFVSMLGYITLLYSLPDFALSIHLSRSQSAEVITFLNLGTAIGRPFIGILSDRFGRIKVAAILTFACGTICFAIWIPARSFGVTVLFALVSGAILGVFWVTVGPICAEIVGLQQLQSLLSISWLTIVLPTLFSETIALRLRRPDSGREYLYPQLFAGIAYIVASAFLFELSRRHENRERIRHAER
ncbi:hypothetical protein IMSHALPRED_007419 [Imshaugia aleurites]|uniref:Major facilitator superfamily (MFS) profile domain-containing protein n=1 Tax=Imshaugia aleurites TaxID=172621 RepID=A0A8H3IUC3_9LECA|nr:hypothetical protein IMSHALPRED_007419 [Imshaugia aleurites]